MRIRRTVPRDVDALCELYALPHVTPFMRAPAAESIERAMSDADAMSVVMENDDGIAAHALIKSAAANWGITEFSQLLVRAPRRGFGRAMMQWVLQEVFEMRKAHRLYLEGVAANTVARKLYEAAGFSLEGLFRDGFPADDGTYHDLAAYGMLHAEFASARIDVESSTEGATT